MASKRGLFRELEFLGYDPISIRNVLLTQSTLEGALFVLSQNKEQGIRSELVKRGVPVRMARRLAGASNNIDEAYHKYTNYLPVADNIRNTVREMGFPSNSAEVLISELCPLEEAIDKLLNGQVSNDLITIQLPKNPPGYVVGEPGPNMPMNPPGYNMPINPPGYNMSINPPGYNMPMNPPGYNMPQAIHPLAQQYYHPAPVPNIPPPNIPGFGVSGPIPINPPNYNMPQPMHPLGQPYNPPLPNMPPPLYSGDPQFNIPNFPGQNMPPPQVPNLSGYATVNHAYNSEVVPEDLQSIPRRRWAAPSPPNIPPPNFHNPEHSIILPSNNRESVTINRRNLGQNFQEAYENLTIAQMRVDNNPQIVYEENPAENFFELIFLLENYRGMLLINLLGNMFQEEEGVSEDTMANLKRENYSLALGLSTDNCVICLEDFEINLEIIVLKCKHGFHKDCIESWLKKSTVCPLCKTELEEGRVNEED